VGLKPDHWIRKMCLEHKMIDPFEEKQVRNGVISYGVSSYGYDIRVADEFKIFTPNPYNTVVDPKHLDERSLIPFKGDVCIIPPNSFALAVTVEYFRIPRSVLTVTVGKSTYARCFRGDTRVALVDGTSATLEEMVTRAEQGEMFFGYSVGPFGRIIVTELTAPRYIGRDSLIEIILDNNESIFCTPDHEFVTRDGQLRQASDLHPDDALMPLYRQVARGYEMVYQPLNGQLHPTHRLADEWNVRHGIYEDTPNTHRHHIDFDRRNNRPWNLTRMDASQHIRLHNANSYGEDFDPVEHGAAISAALQRLWQEDAEWRENYARAQRERMLAFWHSADYVAQRETLHSKRMAYWTEARREQKAELMRHYYDDPANREKRAELSRQVWANASEARREQQREIMRKLKTRAEITAEVVRKALDETGSIRGAARLLNCDRAVFRRFPEVIAAFKGASSKKTTANNHKVQAIRNLPGDHDVYCLTVPEAGNFALEAGVFVRNCGILTNVTPFEPGWEGYVTLEISNTTPLPAKIYAGEGIAQVLFFEADEPCEVSYADRKGKYQGQTGIVLPRV